MLTQVGRYQIVRELASGGMGTVYLGRALGAAGFERLVAIKCCHPHLREHPDFVSQFLDEARLSASIRHPNVVATLDVVDAEALAIVLEYIEGGTVAGLIKSTHALGARLPLPVVLRIGLDTLAGLESAHRLTDAHGERLHLIHRDVSPQNVLVGVDGVARIADFGLVKAESRLTVTRVGRLKGKVPYMAPEQLLGRALDHRVDLYSLGVVLWEAAAGRRLFNGSSDQQISELILKDLAPPLSSVRPDAPPNLDTFFARALCADPDHRFSSAAKMAASIEALGLELATSREVGELVRRNLSPTAPDEGTHTVVTLSGGRRTLPPRHRLRIALVGAAACAALVALIALARPRRPQPTPSPDAPVVEARAPLEAPVVALPTRPPPLLLPAAPTERSAAPVPRAPEVPDRRIDKQRARHPGAQSDPAPRRESPTRAQSRALPTPAVPPPPADPAPTEEFRPHGI